MALHLLKTGAGVLALGYRVTRDLQWYASRRLHRLGEPERAR